MIGDRELFSTKAVSLPKPYFVVFYNGTDEQPERLLLKLTELYETGDRESRIRITEEQPELELKTLVININRGYNEELKRSCRDLYGYMGYVDKVREFAKIYPREVAVKMAIDYCIEHDILADFLTARRAEVMSMSIFEYDQEAHLRQVAEENKAVAILECIESLRKTLGLTAEQAMEALRIPETEWSVYMKNLK